MATQATEMQPLPSPAGESVPANKQTNVSLIVTGCIVAIVFICLGLICIGVIRKTNRRNNDLETASDPSKTQRLDKVAASRPYRQWKQETENSSQLAQRSSNYIVCTICLEILGDDDMVRHLPCSHVFHSECLNKWFIKQHYTCPLCKARYIKRGKKFIM